MTGEQYLILAAVLAAGVAAFHDWRTGEIPNWLTLGGLAAAGLGRVTLGYLSGGGSGALRGLLTAVAALVLCGLIPFLLFRVGAMGGGDLKLLVAVGVFLGPLIGVEAQMYSFIIGAIYAPARLAYQGKLLQTLGNSALLVKNVFVPKAKRRELPTEMMSELRFAPSVFVASLVIALLYWGAA
ncbi:MAG: A24 family peptidase [Polyangiaceae bacterium]